MEYTLYPVRYEGPASIEKSSACMVNRIENAENLVGMKLWACDLRYGNYNEKPYRSVAPAEFLFSKVDVKRVWNKRFHLLKLNKSGEPLKTQVQIFPNVIGSTGMPIYLYDSESECRAKYIELCEKAQEGLTEQMAHVIKVAQDKIKKMTTQIKSQEKFLDKLS
ncbi:hypothetical protein KAR91_83735 [Candidatus Pacearchaeota archaeon]|nr:hypothetical protein [Candidatus Pacearchaeota archaeon]